jgi:thiamine-phosphate pyrophosphorylase
MADRATYQAAIRALYPLEFGDYTARMSDYPCRLYLISPPTLEVAAFKAILAAALAAGDVGAFQLRLKDASDAQIIKAATALLPICHAHGVALVLNDRVDLVRKTGADGVHLGQDDTPMRDARAELGEDAIIGVSCHDSGHMAMEAGEAGADYVAFGAFYPTQSKSAEKLAKYGTPDAQLLQWWTTYTTVPCIAIGGMTPQNCGPLVTAGADFIAAITAVWSHPRGAGEAVKEFNQAIKKATKARPAAIAN